MTTFEVAHDAPHLFDLSPYKPAGLHQGFSFLPKVVCNVRDVEFARAYRITNTTIEPISFTVPRVKTAYFQDDLFPETKVLWQPTLTSAEWLDGSLKQAQLLDLRPDDMKLLSESRGPSRTPSTRSSVGPPVVEKENAPPPQLDTQMHHTFNVNVVTAGEEWSE